MRVNFNTISINKNLNTKNNQNKEQVTKNSYVNSWTNSPLNNGVYGRALVFKSRTVTTSQVETAKTVLRTFLEKKVEPFLAENQRFDDKNQQLTMRASDVASKLYDATVHKVDAFNIYDNDYIKTNFSRPLAYLQNKNEYQYLMEKSQKYFSSEEARSYAESVKNLFGPHEYLDSFDIFLNSLGIDQKKVNNGFAGLKAKLAKTGLVQKRENLHEAETLSLFNLHFVNNVALFNENAKGAISDSIDIANAERTIKYVNKIPEIVEEMRTHDRLLPELNARTEKAEKLFNENGYTESELGKNILAYELKRQGIINRAMKKVSNFVEQNPQFKWDSSRNAEADEILKQQSEANKKLHGLIEESKKEFFSPESVAKREAQVEADYQNWSDNNGYTPEDLTDLPF